MFLSLVYIVASFPDYSRFYLTGVEKNHSWKIKSGSGLGMRLQGRWNRSDRPGNRRTNVLTEITSPTLCLQARSSRIVCTDPCPHEGATHASRSEFCLVVSLIVFRATPAENVCHHVQNLFVLRYPQLSGPWRSCGHGSVQTIRELLACKKRVDDVISVNPLVRQLPGLLDLSRHSC